MRLRDWIHPGWFALYDWWRARRDSEWLDDELRAAHQPTPYGLARLHRGGFYPGQVIAVPNSESGRLLAEAARKYAAPFKVIVKRDPLERENAILAEEAFVDAARQASAAKLERLSYNGPLRISPMPLAPGDRWPGSELAVVTRIEHGSWMDHRYPGDTEMVRIWTRADPAA